MALCVPCSSPRVRTDPEKSWNFIVQNSRPWKVQEKGIGPGNWKILESPGIMPQMQQKFVHMDVLHCLCVNESLGLHLVEVRACQRMACIALENVCSLSFPGCL